jgi:hypothetical protein
LGARAFLMGDWKGSRDGRSSRAWSLSRYTSDTGLTTLKNGRGRLEGLVGSSMPGSSSTARKRSEQWMWSCCCLMGGFLMLLLLFTCIGVVLWLVFRPHSPEFSLQALNITSLTVCCCFNLFCFPPSLPPFVSPLVLDVLQGGCTKGKKNGFLQNLRIGIFATILTTMELHTNHKCILYATIVDLHDFSFGAERKLDCTIRT